jgi:hypothetical protein
MDMIETQIAYYKANRPELTSQHNGKFLLIKDQQVTGVFDTRSQAQDAGRGFETGTYIIERPVNLANIKK